MYLVNDTDSLPTFETANGRSWIDLSITSDSLTRHVQSWDVLEYEKYSDHRYIKLEIFQSEEKKGKRLTQMGVRKVLEALEKDNWLKSIAESRIQNRTQLEHIIQTFYHKIENLIKHYSKVVKNADKKPKAWWTPELEIERKKVRALRRRYQRAKDDLREEFRLSYHQELKIYHNKLEEAKNQSWKEYCSQHNKNPFTLPYKLAANKIKKAIIFHSILKEDSQATTSREETISYLLRNLHNVADTTKESDEGQQVHAEECYED